MDFKRLFVEKKEPFDVESKIVKDEIKNTLGINVNNVKVIIGYDIAIDEEFYEDVKRQVLSEVTTNYVHDENYDTSNYDRYFAYEYLRGQYDQRADSASECIQILTMKKIVIYSFKLILIKGKMDDNDFIKIKNYFINPVESMEIQLTKPEYKDIQNDQASIKTIPNFINSSEEELKCLHKELSLAMSFENLEFCQEYFKNQNRNPFFSEIKVIDTYWSDHCRHTTFLTQFQNVKFLNETSHIKEAHKNYLALRKILEIQKPECLMDMATIGAKALKKQGYLKNIDESEEINACSINIDVDINGVTEPWLLMFKNETHNHPTEIEPFGGAATCLGGAIRDPLSGRSYVYGAMRITGAADPRTPLSKTLKNKLPQKKITTSAASGYSSYGNQIGLATGTVREFYHPKFVAKRMELGAVIGAAPKKNVRREEPKVGDIVILLGGRTGRDGIGGATGSSKEHNEESLTSCGSEVQKGNPVTERKIQRLFRNEEATRLIKRCNDFGAGGVAVAIGELADGIMIDLDAVPKKYMGLDCTEIAISESQERMAVIVEECDGDKFINLANSENLEATIVAKVTDDNTLTMMWRGDKIVELKRDFLNSSGALSTANVEVGSDNENYFVKRDESNVKSQWENTLKDLNVCSQRGLVENFDSTIGRNTVLFPYGGETRGTVEEGLAFKIPVLSGNTNTCSLMTYGFNPYLCDSSPFYGALYSVIESVSRIVALGGDYKSVYLSFQEYFEKLGSDPLKWGKPFSALLGALKAQMELKIGAIGGKDSMSGSFNELSVPPSLVSFAVTPSKVENVISASFKDKNSKVILIKTPIDKNEINFDILRENFDLINKLNNEGKIKACMSIKEHGICEAISMMCFGNMIGFNFNEDVDGIFDAAYGSFIIEVNSDFDETLLKNSKVIGYTSNNCEIQYKDVLLDLKELRGIWEKPLHSIFPVTIEQSGEVSNITFNNKFKKVNIRNIKPKVFIPVFPGTNCEYDSISAFEGIADVESVIFNNLSKENINESILKYEKAIKNANIIMLPGGFSSGDEPDGSGKFIATVFMNERIKEATMELLKVRDGLIIGICNGFQALIKLGLLPYGEIGNVNENSPTLTHNLSGRHESLIARTRIASTMSPWFSMVNVGDIHSIPISHGEGRFVASKEHIDTLIKSGQICTQYVDMNGNATMEFPHNPNGSVYAVEGITSPDGRILGKMGHSERIGKDLYKNIDGNFDQKIFLSGVNYFK